MSLERGRLRALVNACDLDGICDWVDEVVTSAKASAIEEHIAASGADGGIGDTAALAVEAFDRHCRLPGSHFFHELTVEEQRAWHKAVDYLVRATRAGTVRACLAKSDGDVRRIVRDELNQMALERAGSTAVKPP